MHLDLHSKAIVKVLLKYIKNWIKMLNGAIKPVAISNNTEEAIQQ